VLPLERSDKSKRGLAWADVNADGRTDLLVAEPERGQISFYEQKADGALHVAARVSDPGGCE
jgi:hypothetical protein